MDRQHDRQPQRRRPADGHRAGVIGAFVGGFLFHLFGHVGVTGINIYSIFVAVIGSVVLLVLYHAFTRRRTF